MGDRGCVTLLGGIYWLYQPRARETQMNAAQVTVHNATNAESIFTISKYGQKVTYYIDKINDRALICGLLDGDNLTNVAEARKHYAEHR